MGGFDNGSQQGGVFFQAKQFGSVLRGFGPPVPQSGVVGDVYIDVQTWQIFNKRLSDGGVNPWGNFLFVVPVAYRTSLKWFSSSAPGDDIGVAGDYCLLWGGWANYGMQPSIYGPKQATSWPENGEGPNTTIAALNSGFVLPVGLTGEGALLPESNSTQLVALGLTSEYILAIPVTATAGAPVAQLGLQSGPALATLVGGINPQFGAEDQHAV